MGVLSKFVVPVAGGDAHTLMPKLQYRFRVTFGNMGNQGAGDLTVLTRQIISVTRPQLTHDEMIVDVYNSRIYLAGKHVWNPITIILRDDVKSEVIKQVDTQLQLQLNHASQSGARTGSEYKFNMDIETLDGSDTPGVEDHWSLFGCYLSDVAYGDSNYATSDVQQITMTIRFDNAQHGAGAEGTGDEYLAGLASRFDDKDTANTGAGDGGGTPASVA